MKNIFGNRAGELNLNLIVIIFLVIVISCCFIFCKPTSIVGKWERLENSKGFDYIEFFGDGTYVSAHSNYEGSYSIDGNRIRLQGILVDSLTYTFKLDGDRLVFINNNGDVRGEYERVD